MSYRSDRVYLINEEKVRMDIVPREVKVKRIMVTLPEELVDRLEIDTKRRGLNLTKSNRIQLMLERELTESERKLTKAEKKETEDK